LSLLDAADQLIEAIRFISQLAGCDGAIVFSQDLTLLGFGAEIRAEMEDDISALEVIDEARRKYKACDVEQFGMRHRSAVKLASKGEGSVILAVSQDGPITAVWRDDRNVLVKRGVSLANMNMPWA
jgi:DNA integrity scanning protein DisA with diadenylate cyclase activity